MSRIGKKPVPLPPGVTAAMQGDVLEVKGPKGTLQQAIDPRIKVQVGGDAITFERSDDLRPSRALHGLYRSLAANMCQGVTEGFKKTLEVVGTGFGGKVESGKIVLSVGFCHEIALVIPDGIEVACPNPTTVQVTGIDKQAVGDFAARIRKSRPPEPYKGKGIKYADEVVRRKAGKTLAGAGA